MISLLLDGGLQEGLGFQKVSLGVLGPDIGGKKHVPHFRGQSEHMLNEME